MNVIRAGGRFINLNLVQSMCRYRSTFTKRNFIEIKWNGAASEGIFLIMSPEHLTEKFYEDIEPELYQALSKIIDDE